jgi:hypothetical protein
VTFQGLNASALPGCEVIPGAQIWKAGTISGANLTTTSNTVQKFTTPVNGVKRVRLRGFVALENTAFRWLNSGTRTNSSQQYTLQTNQGTVLANFQVNGPAVILDIVFPTTISMSYLLGGPAIPPPGPLGDGNAYYTHVMRCTGIDLFAN